MFLFLFCFSFFIFETVSSFLIPYPGTKPVAFTCLEAEVLPMLQPGSVVGVGVTRPGRLFLVVNGALVLAPADGPQLGRGRPIAAALSLSHPGDSVVANFSPDSAALQHALRRV